MPAPRNDAERNRIYAQAVSLFMQRGYERTTYKDIADACATTKSMVQHYFPKKELIAERFFREKLDEFLHTAQQILPVSYSQLDLLTCVGLLHYDFLLNDAGAELFCNDLLVNRTLTDSIIREEFQWAQAFLRDGTMPGTSMQAQFVIALGGAYDYLFQVKTSGEAVTASSVQLAAMLAFWLPMGLDAEEVSASVQLARQLTGIQ